MKRNELKVGETYAVLSPSQKIRGRYGYSPAKKVTVLDVEPVWGEYTSHRYNDIDQVEVTNAAGDLVMADDRAVEVTGSYRDAAAKRSVLVVREDAMRGEEPYYRRTVVPLSNIRMTWADYEARAAEADAAIQARFDARQDAEKAAANKRAAAIALRDALSTKLEGTPFTARVLDGEVVLAGPFNELVDLVERSTS